MQQHNAFIGYLCGYDFGARHSGARAEQAREQCQHKNRRSVISHHRLVPQTRRKHYRPMLCLQIGISIIGRSHRMVGVRNDEIALNLVLTFLLVGTFWS